MGYSDKYEDASTPYFAPAHDQQPFFSHYPGWLSEVQSYLELPVRRLERFSEQQGIGGVHRVIELRECRLSFPRRPVGNAHLSCNDLKNYG